MKHKHFNRLLSMLLVVATLVNAKLYEANATGKLPDKHFSRLLAGYDEEQAALETCPRKTAAPSAAATGSTPATTA